MSVKIRISYNTSEELQGVIRLLHPVIKSCKVAKNKDGRYKKAYVELKCEGTPMEQREKTNRCRSPNEGEKIT